MFLSGGFAAYLNALLTRQSSACMWTPSSFTVRLLTFDVVKAYCQYVSSSSKDYECSIPRALKSRTRRALFRCCIGLQAYGSAS